MRLGLAALLDDSADGYFRHDEVNTAEGGLYFARACPRAFLHAILDGLILRQRHATAMNEKTKHIAIFTGFSLARRCWLSALSLSVTSVILDWRLHAGMNIVTPGFTARAMITAQVVFDGARHRARHRARLCASYLSAEFITSSATPPPPIE